jgi:hypothetical protein
MAIAALDPRSLTEDAPPELDAFLQLFGEVCAVPAVSRIGIGREGLAFDFWVRLGSDETSDEDAVYGALQRYRAHDDSLPIDLHVIFPDEPDAAWPSSVKTIFTRG